MKRIHLIPVLLFLFVVMGMAAWPAPVAAASSPGAASDVLLTSKLPPVYDHPTTPQRLIGSYVNALNRGDYDRANSYWESSAAPSALAKHIKKGRSVVAIVRPPIVIEGAAGSLYAYVPTLWLEKENGTRTAWYACFTTHRVNLPGTKWYIQSAGITRAPNAGGWPFLNACPDAINVVDQLTKYDDATTPERLIASFFDAINRQDYARAYDYLENPPFSFDQFWRRYHNIKRIDPLIRVPVWVKVTSKGRYAKVHFLELVTYKSGNRRVYESCYTLHRPNQPGSPWKILHMYRRHVRNASGWRLAHRCR